MTAQMPPTPPAAKERRDCTVEESCFTAISFASGMLGIESVDGREGVGAMVMAVGQCREIRAMRLCEFFLGASKCSDCVLLCL